MGLKKIMPMISEPECVYCKWHSSDSPCIIPPKKNSDIIISPPNFRFFCKAYPKRIPTKILSGDVKHTKPLPGQVGNYVFKRRND